MLDIQPSFSWGRVDSLTKATESLLQVFLQLYPFATDAKSLHEDMHENNHSINEKFADIRL